MLYADLFGFLGLDRGWDVQEGFTGFGSVLDERSDLRACTVYEGKRSGGHSHVFDLLDGEICICWDSDGLWSDVDDDHHRSGNKSLEELVNFLVGSSKFRSRVIPPDHPFASCECKNAHSALVCLTRESFSTHR